MTSSTSTCTFRSFNVKYMPLTKISDRNGLLEYAFDVGSDVRLFYALCKTTVERSKTGKIRVPSIHRGERFQGYWTDRTNGASHPVFSNSGSLSDVNPLQILQHPEIAGDLKSTAFTTLRRLCGTFGRLPTSCLVDQDFGTQGGIPFATRGYTDLWERDWNGRKVAVKTLRFRPDDDKSKITKVKALLAGWCLGMSRSTHHGL